MIMNTHESTTANPQAVKGIPGVVVYADDFHATLDFYTRVLGLTVYTQVNERSCFLYVGDNPNGLYLEGGYSRQPIDEHAARLSFMLMVPSALTLHAHLEAEAAASHTKAAAKASCAKLLVHDAPVELGENAYWFQVIDPSGNIVEICGGK